MINKFRNLSFIFVMIITAVCLSPASDLFAADESQEFVSICHRTEQVRMAIQKEVSVLRLVSGKEGEVRCYAIRPSELRQIEYLQIVEKDITTMKRGDFAGLDALKILDLEGNRITKLDASVFSDLNALQYLILARNPLTAIGLELVPLPNLKHVDFSACKLSSVSAKAFSSNHKLEAVFLAGNSLSELPEGLFSRNSSLQVIDLSRNLLKQLPVSCLSDRSSLKSLDISQNRIERIDDHQFLNQTELRVVNLANNPIITLQNNETLQKKFNANTGIILAKGQSFRRKQNNLNHSQSVAPYSQDHIFISTERVRTFVRNHWHLPLNIKIYFSSREQADLESPGRRAGEERLLLRQLEEIREAYRRAAFDFFEVQISFAGSGSSQKTPVLSFNKKQIGIAILLNADAKKADNRGLITDDQILELLADHFNRSHSIKWYSEETSAVLETALKRDFEKVTRMNDELQFDIIRFADLIDTATERSQKNHDKDFFTNSELIDVRFIQFRVLLTFQRLENTIARWKLAESDPAFPNRAEVRMLLSEASEVYRTHLDWFINTVVGGRATINILDKTWYHRNPIFKILDSEVPAGFFNLDGRLSTRIPSGAIRDLLERRLSLPFLYFLRETRFLDKNVSENDISKSPLREQMMQSKDKIRKNRQTLKKIEISYLRSFKELWDARIKNSVKFPLYQVVVGVAGWIGDTRLSHPSPAITDAQMDDMKAHLKPGDLIIERTDYYLSNAFLGGFWPHGILYLGPKEEWTKMTLADGTTLAEDPWIAEHITPHYRSEKDGRPALVMEAISEGVVFNSLEEAAQKDYIAIFRPKFSPQEQEAKIAGIIKRALKYYGRPYDFDFDFFTDDKLVCTELLYRAYHPDINFLIQKEAIRKPNPPIPGMIHKAGRDTMPAGEIAKLALYMLDHKAPDSSIGYGGQLLEFVRLYMKEGKGKPARIFSGDQGIQVLKQSLKQ